jgi:hypothetical protein
MAEEKKPTTQISVDDVQNMLRGVAAEVYNVLTQAERERQKQIQQERERTRQAIVEAVRAGQEHLAAIQQSCSHTRSDGTSRVWWMTFSDGVQRGFCCLCNKRFEPGVEGYEVWLSKPIVRAEIM